MKTARQRSVELLEDLNPPEGLTEYRIAALEKIIRALTPDELKRLQLVLSPYWGGAAYGKTKARLGVSARIGGGGRNPGSKQKPYQIWAFWGEGEP